MTLSRREKLALVLCGLVGLYYVLYKHSRKIDTQTASTVLAPNVVEKIIVNPSTHQLTVITSQRTDHLFLPDRPSSIEVTKSGQINVTSSQFGMEFRPFCGFQASDKLRIAFGIDGLYYKRLDLGLGIADKIGPNTPVLFVALNYTVWSNLRVGLTYDTAKYPGVILSVRF